MNRTMWRQLASGLLAATLSLGIAACDDDTSSGTDMGTADMSASVDMTMMGTPGIGQIVLADVVGTVYTTQPAPKAILYRTHSLIGLAAMPVVVPTSDPSSNLQLSPPGGCTINRFTATNIPPSDGDAGNITIAGWNQFVVGVSAVTGSTSGGMSMYPITCARGGALMKYGCGFAGMMDADGGGMGMTTGSVIFPLIPNRCVLLDPTTHLPTNTTCPGSTPLGWPYGQAACTPARYLPNPQDPVAGCTFPTTCATAIEACEQSPILPGTSNIVETIAGGTDYPAGSHTFGTNGDADAGVGFFPQPVYLVSVTQGTSTTSIAGTDPFTMGPSLSMADGAIDKTKDLTLSFSCDGTATAGSGCTGSGDLVALLITTSTSTRALFGSSTATGSAECIAGLPAGKVTIAANQLAALIGSQTGGSYELALARLRLTPSSAGSHLVAYGAGMGVFGFTNQ